MTVSDQLFNDSDADKIGFSHEIGSDGSFSSVVKASSVARMASLRQVTQENSVDASFDEPRKLYMAAICQFAVSLGEHIGAGNPEIMTNVTAAMAFLYPRIGILPTGMKDKDDHRIDGVLADVGNATKENADRVRDALVAAGIITVVTPERISKAQAETVAALERDDSVLLVVSGASLWEASRPKLDELVKEDGVVVIATLPSLAASIAESPRNLVEVMSVISKTVAKHAHVKPSTMINCIAHLGVELTMEMAKPEMRERSVTEFGSAVTRIGKVMLNMNKEAGHA